MSEETGGEIFSFVNTEERGNEVTSTHPCYIDYNTIQHNKYNNSVRYQKKHLTLLFNISSRNHSLSPCHCHNHNQKLCCSQTSLVVFVFASS